AADPQPLRLHLLDEALADAHGHVFMEAFMVAERAEKQLEAFALDDRLGRRIVDDEVGEIRLAGDWAQRGEFRRREAHQVERTCLGVRYVIEPRLLGRNGKRAGLAEVLRVHRAASYGSGSAQ